MTVTTLLLACLAAQFLTRPHVLPFRPRFVSFAGGGVVRIEPRSGLALPPPLRAGETLPLALQPLSTRLALALGGNVSGRRALRIVLGARGRRSVAVFYEAEGEGLQRTASFPDGEAVFPARLEADDPALVRLRARRSPLDLHGFESALGEGWALPFVLRGRPYALLVLGPRPGGR